MKRILAISILAALMIGCGGDGGGSKDSTPTVKRAEGSANTVFEGQQHGWEECVQAFDELLCPPEYKKGTLAAGTYDYFKDKDGNAQRLDKGATLPKGATPLVPVRNNEGGE